ISQQRTSRTLARLSQMVWLGRALLRRLRRLSRRTIRLRWRRLRLVRRTRDGRAGQHVQPASTTDARRAGQLVDHGCASAARCGVARQWPTGEALRRRAYAGVEEPAAGPNVYLRTQGDDPARRPNRE